LFAISPFLGKHGIARFPNDVLIACYQAAAQLTPRIDGEITSASPMQKNITRIDR